MNEFLAVPHHQLLIGLAVVAALLLAQWVTTARRAGRREALLIQRLTESQSVALGPVVERIQAIETRVNAELARARRESGEQAAALRQEVLQSVNTLGGSQRGQLEGFGQRLDGFEQKVAAEQTRQRESLATQLEKLREENGKRLDEMRRTVDEKLQSTLEKRLGESFNQVSERLEAVHKGLGEMQQLATGVGDLKRVLTNVKTRGTWGEVQLGQLLDDMLTAEQYATNMEVQPGSGERVEFAIRLPGAGETEAPVWLPIDAKFPREDYERLVAASEAGDAGAVEEAAGALETRILTEAKSIAARYLAPPHTTDFAVLYLPTEGLYAEITRRPGLADRLQRDHRVVIAGPNTFSALLNSLQMGFRTLAIQQRSGEVWQILGAVKTEFGRFGDTLEKVKKKLSEASNHMDRVDVRSRAMQRRLRDVEALQASGSAPVLDLLGGEGGSAGAEGGAGERD